MKNWYKIKNLAPNVASISLTGEIGVDVSATRFIDELRAMVNVTEIRLNVHSPGGNLIDGLAIYNALRNHPAKVIGHVDGIAASAASVVLMASDWITMPEDAFLMIHNATGGTYGDSSDLRSMAELIDKLQSSAVDIYERRTQLDRQRIIDMMQAETWLTATEAQALGFCDEVTGRVALAAKLDRFNLKSCPLPEPDLARELQTPRDLDTLLRGLGLSKTQAAAVTASARRFASAAESQDTDAAITQRLQSLAEKFNKPFTSR